jgi:hypothetical protein
MTAARRPVPINQRRLFSIPEFGERYHVADTKSYQLINGGALVAVTVGGGPMIREDDAEKWLASLPVYIPRGLGVQVALNPKLQELLSSDVSILNLSQRAIHYVCQNNHVRTVADLVQFSQEEILRMPYINRCTCNEIKEKLAIHGLTLGMKFRESESEDIPSELEVAS